MDDRVQSYLDEVAVLYPDLPPRFALTYALWTLQALREHRVSELNFARQDLIPIALRWLSEDDHDLVVFARVLLLED